MKTRVNSILVEDDLGVAHRISCRCPNGDFKRKFVMKLVNEATVLPTEGIVTLLGEVLTENQRLISRLREVEEGFEIASAFAESEYGTIDAATELAETLLAVLNGETGIGPDEG